MTQHDDLEDLSDELPTHRADVHPFLEKAEVSGSFSLVGARGTIRANKEGDPNSPFSISVAMMTL